MRGLVILKVRRDYKGMAGWRDGFYSKHQQVGTYVGYGMIGSWL